MSAGVLFEKRLEDPASNATQAVPRCASKPSKYIWGEVKELNGVDRTAIIKPMFAQKTEMIDFDYCMICAGCNFGPFHKWGESLWFPTIHEEARSEGSWPQFDERCIEGRRRHILDEDNKVAEYSKNKNSIVVVGAGFIGVEWITEIEHFFKDCKLTIIDFLPNCLGPLPKKAKVQARNTLGDVLKATEPRAATRCIKSTIPEV